MNNKSGESISNRLIDTNKSIKCLIILASPFIRLGSIVIMLWLLNRLICERPAADVKTSDTNRTVMPCPSH